MTLFFPPCFSFCRHSIRRSLAEEEIKTESDVVEGMDVSMRSKGKPKAPEMQRANVCKG